MSEGEAKEAKDSLSVIKVIKAQSKDEKWSCFEFELRIKNDEKNLNISARNVQTKRLFVKDFNHKELINCGFLEQQTIVQIAEFIQDCINGSNNALSTKITIGFVSSGEKAIHDEYVNGDELYLSIKENDARLYNLLLNEMKQSDVLILQELVKDLQKDNAFLRNEMQKRDTEIQKQMSSLRDELKAEFKDQKSEKLTPQIAFWTSTEKNDLDAKKWNTSILNTTDQTFELSADQTNVIFKLSGIYRIFCVVGTYNVLKQAAFLYINGTTVCIGYNFTSLNTDIQQATLSYVAKLQVNDYITVFAISSYDQAACNFLTIERIGD